jgi:ornithine cyclodeaminase/alanine dehydrogenase-like protein (mu-crystallin family)
MLVVRDSELRAIVPMADAIDAMADAFVSVSSGSADQPLRVATGDGGALAMLATRRDGARRSGVVCKVVGISLDNRSRGLPSISASVLWLDAETAMPTLLVEGTALTALRTGAASGLATRLLAAPGASTLAMIGAGGQAADQVRAVCAVRPIDTVRIFSRSGVSADALVRRLAPELPDVRIEAAASSEAAVDGADVVSCATDAVSPVVDAASIDGRVHVNAVGSFRPEMRELPLELLRKAELVAIDQMDAALAEAGELIAAVGEDPAFAERLVELGVLVADPPLPQGVTVFKSVGIAMQDWAICNLVETRIRAGAPVGVAPAELVLATMH